MQTLHSEWWSMRNVNVEIINLNPVVEVQFRWDRFCVKGSLWKNHRVKLNFSLSEAVRELVLLVTPEFPSSFVLCSGQLLNNSKSLSENIGESNESDWTKYAPIRLVIVNSHFFSFWTNFSIAFGLTNHCPYSTLKDYFKSTQFISRKFGICRSCDPRMLQSGFESKISGRSDFDVHIWHSK